MQHLDEGTIHAWLDGALSSDEATRVEAHVAECAQCASSVAEARGFIAASSRILTKLDDAPRGVVPLQARRPRNVAAWRAAAAVLIVALGSVIVARNRGGEVRTSAASEVRATDTMSAVSAVHSLAADSQSANTTVVPPGGTAAAAAVSGAPLLVPGSGSGRVAAVPPSVASSVRPSQVAMPEPRRVAQNLSKAPAAERRAEGTDQAASAAIPFSSLPAAVALDARTSSPSALLLVREDTIPRGKRSVYAITPGDTVILLEESVTVARIPSSKSMAMRPAVTAQSPDLGSIVATRGGNTAQRNSAAGSVGSIGEVQGVAKTATPSAPAPPLNPVNTLSWVDSASGKQFTLSGRLSTSQLEEIRHRIERDRAQRATRSP